MAYETASQRRERIHEEALQDAFGPAKPSKPAPSAPAKPKEPAYQGSLTAIKEAGGAAIEQIKGGFAKGGPEGGYQVGAGAAGLAGAPFAGIGQLVQNVINHFGGEAQAPEWVRKFLNASEALSALPEYAVRMSTAGSKEKQDEIRKEMTAHLDQIMGGEKSWGDAASHLAMLEAVALPHAVSGGRKGVEAPKPGTPQDARASAAAKMQAAQVVPAPAPVSVPVEAPKLAPKLTKEQAAKAAVVSKFDQEAAALKAKRVVEQPPAEAPEPVGNGRAPAPGESAAETGLPVPDEVVKAAGERAEPIPNQGVVPDAVVAATEGLPGDMAEAQINAKMGIPPSAERPTSEAMTMPGERPADPTAAPAEVPQGTVEAAPEGPVAAEGTAVQGAPQVQTIADLHTALEPSVVASYGPPNEAAMKATREGAISLAQELRAAGVKESEIRDAVRAKLNEGGILSKNQRQRALGDIEAPEGPIRAELNRIRVRMHEISEALGGAETGAIGVEGDPVAALEAAKGLLRVVTTRKLSAKMMEPGWITGDDPLGVLQKTAEKMGVEPEQAPGLVQKVVQAVKDRLNSTDPEGAQFNTAAMGFNPLDFWRLFHKDADLTSVPYDRAAAENAVGNLRKTIPGADEALKLDLRKSVGEEQAASVRLASDEALKGVAGIVSRVEAGGRVEPGELQHAVTLAGVLAEKARNAEIRASGSYGRSGPEVVKPVNADTMHAFAQSIHDAMSEPELYGKLTSLEPSSRANWLANMYRASTVPSLWSGLGLRKMYMNLYYNEMLSAPFTWAMNAVNSTASLPYTLATEGIAAQIGRFTKAETKVVPGQMGQLWAGYWSAIHDQWRGIAAGDVQGLKLILEQEGELNLARPNPQTFLDNVLNIGSIPSVALGVVNSPIKVTLRRGALFAETFRTVTQAAKSDPTLVGDKFWTEVERLRREPTEDIMKYANEFADTWSFTKHYDDLRGVLQSNGYLGDLGRIFLDPFARIGVNALSRAVEAHPFTALISPDFWQDITTPGGRQNRAMAKLAIGSAVLVTTMGMGQMGWVTGDGPADPHANKMWQQAGNVPNMIMNPATGKLTIPHKMLGFFSGWFASGADMAAVWQGMDPNDRQAAAVAMAYAISEQTTHAGIVDTWAKIAAAVSNGLQGQELWDLIRDKLESMSLVAPNKVGIIRTVKDFESDGKPLITGGRATDVVDLTRKMILQDVTAGWPGWEKGQPQLRNQFTGKPILRPGLFKDTVNPDDPDAKVAAEIYRLQSAQRGLKFDIAAPKRTIGGSAPVAQGAPVSAQSAYAAIPLESWELDRKIQFQTESKIGGKTLIEALTARIESAEYKRHAEAEKDSAAARAEGWSASRIREIYQTYEKLGEDKLLKEDKHLQWLVNKSKADAQNLQRTSPHSIPPEPPLTQYPRPGQNPR